MFDKASLKLGLDKAVLQSMTPKENNQQLTRKEVEDLLRKGAYGAVSFKYFYEINKMHDKM